MGWLPGTPPFLLSLSLLPEDCLLRQFGPDQGVWAVSRLLRASPRWGQPHQPSVSIPPHRPLPEAGGGG